MLIEWLKANAAKHVEALVIAAVLVFAGRIFLQEHDARIVADAQVKAAQSTIDDLKKQQTEVEKVAKAQVIVLQKEAVAVKTGPQAIESLDNDPQVKAVLPSLTPVPDEPGIVQVNALDLFKGVNACEQNSVNLGACSKELDIEKQIDGQKDDQIVALKKKPSFLRRLGKAALVVGCAAGGGAAGSLAGGRGAAIGAAAGAGVCQMF
jgi:hypothetical protein